jgi:hypothetical protein
MTTLVTSQMLLPRKGPAAASGLATKLSMFHFVEQKPARLGVRGGFGLPLAASGGRGKWMDVLALGL